MEDHEHKAHAKCTTVKWGAILAGAAVVAGALLFAPAITGTIAGMFGGEAAKVGATEVGKKVAENGFVTLIKNFASAIASETGKKLTGAAMLGGGAAYFLTGEQPANHAHHDELARENRESFAMAEDMRKTQMKMMIQAAAAGNPEAQSMMAQMQQGRGA